VELTNNIAELRGLIRPNFSHLQVQNPQPASCVISWIRFLCMVAREGYVIATHPRLARSFERMASKNLSSSLDGFVIGIIGMGDMGKMYARRLSDAGWR
jgi:hypothetical protein